MCNCMVTASTLLNARFPGTAEEGQDVGIDHVFGLFEYPRPKPLPDIEWVRGTAANKRTILGEEPLRVCGTVARKWLVKQIRGE